MRYKEVLGSRTHTGSHWSSSASSVCQNDTCHYPRCCTAGPALPFPSRSKLAPLPEPPVFWNNRGSRAHYSIFGILWGGKWRRVEHFVNLESPQTAARTINALGSPTGYPLRRARRAPDEDNRGCIIFPQQLGKVIKDSQILEQGATVHAH